MEHLEHFFEHIPHILLHALKHSALMLPMLVVVYVLIEFLESRNLTRFENSKLLQGNVSPVFGALFGCVPQCGFSVISTDLYSAKKLSVGALVAVYVSTSDEALPLMLAGIGTSPSSVLWLLLLLAVKVIMGIGIGYLAMFLYPKFFKKHTIVAPRITFAGRQIQTVKDPNASSPGCCNHEIDNKRKFNIKHPILHSLKIFAFIFVINLIMEIIMHFVGEDNLKAFLQSSSYFQPLIALVVGLIPNCASSIVLTQLFLSGALSFGSIITGLSVNAGLGIMVLLRKNRPHSENIFIVSLIIICSLLIGYAFHIFGI
jgi:hypothetical protein